MGRSGWQQVADCVNVALLVRDFTVLYVVHSEVPTCVHSSMGRLMRGVPVMRTARAAFLIT